MGSTRPERIPLFPLNVVLLPGGDLPLHIFEPRYRRMVHDCIECKTEFGMLLSLPKGVVRVGCTAEIFGTWCCTQGSSTWRERAHWAHAE